MRSVLTVRDMTNAKVIHNIPTAAALPAIGETVTIEQFDPPMILAAVVIAVNAEQKTYDVEVSDP